MTAMAFQIVGYVGKYNMQRMFVDLCRAAFVALLLSISLSARADDKLLLGASTETSSPGEIRPSPQLAGIVLGAIDRQDKEDLNECISSEGLKQADYASLL